MSVLAKSFLIFNSSKIFASTMSDKDKDKCIDLEIYNLAEINTVDDLERCQFNSD